MKRITAILLAITLFALGAGIGAFTVSAADTPNATIIGAQLDLGASLTLNYYVTSNVAVEELTMKFTSSSGRETVVGGVYDDANKAYKFAYEGISAQCMTDTVDAAVIYSGSVLAVKDDYSVKAYCDSQITKTKTQLGYNAKQYLAYRELLADLLAYGAAAQEYRQYNVENLANDSAWIDNHQSTFNIPGGVRRISGNADADNNVQAVGLNVSNVNNVYFRIKLTDENVKVYLDGKEVSRDELVASGKYYLVYSDDILASEFTRVFTLTLVKNGVEISKVEYNMEAYVRAKYGSSSVGKLAKAIACYGTATVNYAKALEAGAGGGFDFEEDDEFGAMTNYISDIDSNFDSADKVGDTSWTTTGPTLSLTNDGYRGKALVATGFRVSYVTPGINLVPYITQAGEYEISFKYKVECNDSDLTSQFAGVIRTNSETSFSKNNDGNYYCGFQSVSDFPEDEWLTYSAWLTVLPEDIGRGGEWKFCLHTISNEKIESIYIDEFQIISIDDIFAETPKSVDSATTWVSNELTLISYDKYDDPFNDVTVDVQLTNGTDTYIIPAFWDGGNIWRARFMCPSEGTWTYTTVCSDTSNVTLHGVRNTFECTAYTGDIAVYKHGFVDIKDANRYFTYDDGTPFFYLGDTHWALGGEPLDMVKTVVDKRVAQGFTVIQSEPINAAFKFEDGISSMDILGLRELDAKFAYIAEKGLVHVNASFFYPSSMTTLISNFGGYSNTSMGQGEHSSGNVTLYDISDTAKAYIERICRYWVARYSSYPVMWSLGQEVDNDFFWNRDGFNSHAEWGYVNNPYKLVAKYIAQYDPYDSPLTAHQESTSNTNASNSSFRDVAEHDFYAAQWSPSLTGGSLESVAKDYWNNGQNKPVVNYEGRYCYLWTKNFGARAQGWMSYLSGMFGYGYGAQDTWCYLSTYSESDSSGDGVDTVTPEDKKNATWRDSLEYASAYQVGYMRNFFENIVGDWHTLVPRFDSSSYLSRSSNAYATIASNANHDKIVIYFYNFSDSSLAENPNSSVSNSKRTGTLSGLTKNTTYNYVWFSPVTGEVTESGTFKTSNYNYFGTFWTIPEKATTDMVLYVYK